jgi:hypothetical protein
VSASAAGALTRSRWFWASFVLTVLLSPLLVIWTALVGSVGLILALPATRLAPDHRQLPLVAVLAGLALGSLPYLLLALVVALAG